MRTIKYFDVLYNSDRTEGKGPTVSTGFGFEDEGEARKFVQSEIYAKAYGVMGTKGSKYDVKRETIIIYESISEFLAEAKRDLRQSALDKLSEEEKKALGLI